MQPVYVSHTLTYKSVTKNFPKEYTNCHTFTHASEKKASKMKATNNKKYRQTEIAKMVIVVYVRREIFSNNTSLKISYFGSSIFFFCKKKRMAGKNFDRREKKISSIFFVCSRYHTNDFRLHFSDAHFYVSSIGAHLKCGSMLLANTCIKVLCEMERRRIEYKNQCEIN